MSEKKIKMWDVVIKFRVRKGSYGAKTLKELEDNVANGVGGNEMGMIQCEEQEILIK